MTLEEIAKLAGVSKATASYVLSGKSMQGRVSEKTAARVKAVAEKHGYVPNRAAALFRKGRHHLIAMLMPNLSDFYAGLLAQVELEAEKCGFQVLFGCSFNSPEREAKYVEGMLARRVDGLILLPINIDAQHLHLLHRNRLPTIFFRRRAEATLPHKFMTFHDFRTGYLAAKHVIEKGCRKLVFCSEPSLLRLDYVRIIHEARLAGFRQALTENGLVVGDEGILFHEREPFDNKAFIEEFKRTGFDGIVGVGDDAAIRAMTALTQHGVRVPEEVKVIGIDDSKLCRYAVPAMSSIGLPKDELGARMVEALMRMIKKGEPEADEVLTEPFVVARASTAKHSALDNGKATGFEKEGMRQP
jgi:LacI family transcriptional regulator